MATLTPHVLCIILLVVLFGRSCLLFGLSQYIIVLFGLSVQNTF